MMLLGTLIRRAIAAQSDFPVDVAAREPELAARIQAQAERLNLSLSTFVADTVERFMGQEDSDLWTTIVGNIQRSDDAGYAFIATVMRVRLDHACKPGG